MNIGSFFKNIFSSSAAKSVEAFALTEAQKAVAALKQTTIGATVAADVKAISDKALSGTEKFEAVVANTMPLIANFLTSGGRKTAIAEVEDVARALVQDVFNDTLSTKAASIASVILKLLGIK